MADTVEIGHKRVNKWVVYGGVGAAVVGGILYVKRKGSGSSSSSSSQNATDPVTGLPYSEDNQIDPATGMTYLAEAEQYGSVSAAEAAVSAGYGGVSGTTSGYSGSGYGYPTSSYGYSATGTSNQYATNADWAQAVTAQLPSITGDSQSDVAAAIAHYLAGLPLDSTQANDVQVALAEFGPPPVGSFSIIQQGSGSGPTGTGSTSGSTGSTSSNGTSAGYVSTIGAGNPGSTTATGPMGLTPAEQKAKGIAPPSSSQLAASGISLSGLPAGTYAAWTGYGTPSAILPSGTIIQDNGYGVANVNGVPISEMSPSMKKSLGI